MVFLVKFANDARERALAAERHAYDVALVVRNVSANIVARRGRARPLRPRRGRQDQRQHLLQRLAARRLPDRPARTLDARQSRAAAPRRRAPAALPQARRRARARRARRARQAGRAGISYFYQAGQVGDRHRRSTTSSRRSSAPSASRSADRIEQSQFFSAQADQLHRLSELARRHRRARRDLPRRGRRPGAAPERRRAPPGRDRGRARRGARAGGPRPHAGAVGGEPGAEGRGRASARPPRPSCARSRRWRRSAS